MAYGDGVESGGIWHNFIGFMVPPGSMPNACNHFCFFELPTLANEMNRVACFSDTFLYGSRSKNWSTFSFSGEEEDVSFGDATT